MKEQLVDTFNLTFQRRKLKSKQEMLNNSLNITETVAPFDPANNSCNWRYWIVKRLQTADCPNGIR